MKDKTLMILTGHKIDRKRREIRKLLAEERALLTQFEYFASRSLTDETGS